MQTMELLLITGSAGVWKSTLCREMSAPLQAAIVAHAVIETDELDRMFPRPSAEDLERIRPGTIDVSSINLAAIPDAAITIVRLMASEPALLARLAQREIGSGAEEHYERSLRQVAVLDSSLGYRPPAPEVISWPASPATLPGARPASDR